jgi:hypothetical protein
MWATIRKMLCVALLCGTVLGVAAGGASAQDGSRGWTVHYTQVMPGYPRGLRMTAVYPTWDVANDVAEHMKHHPYVHTWDVYVTDNG